MTAAETQTPPNLIYRDQDLLYRVIREACTEDTAEIVVDTAFAMNRVQNILQNWHINKNVKVTLYKGTEPLLIAENIHKEIKAALNVKVNMPSGGYLYIQTTEALTVIDVNSGKFTSSSTQDETILKTNIEAVHEIARQLRLRNIGGMVIIDFIDMLSRADQLAIMEELELALEPDKAKPQVGQLSDLGLVELTRHRQGQSLSEIFTKKCPHCQGSGCFVNEFNFATPTGEAEMKAKIAKTKMPIATFNKKQEDEDITSEKTELMSENINNTDESNQNRKNNKNRKNKFNKRGKNRFSNAEQQAEVVPTEETKSSVAAVEIPAEKPDDSAEKPKRRGRKAKSTVEKQVETVEVVQDKAAEKPKRRPNRGLSKKTKKAENE